MEAMSLQKISQSLSCSMSAFSSAQRNVDLPLPVVPSMAMPRSLQFFRYATSGSSSCVDERERHDLRCLAQAKSRREVPHVHGVVDRRGGFPAKRLPDVAAPALVAERAVGPDRHAAQPVELRARAHPLGARNDLTASVHRGRVRRPATGGHEHGLPVLVRQAPGDLLERALELRRAVVLALVLLCLLYTSDAADDL